MIKSMTGYGRAEKLFDNYKITIEVKSVNNRFLDQSIRLYKQYGFAEEAIRNCVSEHISRGKVDIFVQFDMNESDDRVITLNENVATGYCNALKSMANILGLKDEITVSTISRFPDVFNVEKPEDDKEQIIADTREVVLMALDDLSAARSGEGERLCTFFGDCIGEIKNIMEIIKGRTDDTVLEYKAKMREKIEQMLAGVDYDESRLLTEVAIFADKVNITEEIVRFESHLNEFEKLILSDIPVGRKLDFTIQELNREANTMGSKCNDFTIGKAVVDLKSEIEKLREQVQNIE